VSDPLFLTLAEATEVHADQIRRYGGQHGVRDAGLLQSALAQPEASFGGEWLHKTLYDMAAAYAYHLSQNHPFFDGNKRTALACALVFLELNGVTILDPKGSLKDAMMQVASSRMDKAQLAELLRKLHKKSGSE
jgi:death-on-curing protein